MQLVSLTPGPSPIFGLALPISRRGEKSEKSLRDILKSLPTSPDNGDARFAIALTIEKTTKLGNPTGCVIDSWVEGIM